MPPSHLVVPFTPRRDWLKARVTPRQLGFNPQRVWSPSPSTDHRTEPYALPKHLVVGVRATQETGAKYSPPPFAVVVESAAAKALVIVSASAGWHRFNAVEFNTTPRGVEVAIDFEGQTNLRAAAARVKVHVIAGRPGESSMDLLTRGNKMLYPAAWRSAGRQPAWWTRPIYCGWGDQVGIAHHLEGVGHEARANAYCIQGLYERWVDRLDEAGVPVGTIIIDAGWSPAGTLEPYDDRWPDLRGFIDRQHKKGRRVLLWMAAWLCDGLPDEWCVFAGNVKLTANPMHPGYRQYLKKQVEKLISPKGYNADGFKIDQLAYVPTIHAPRGGTRFGRIEYLDHFRGQLRPRLKVWGTELLHQLQKDVYDTAHRAKADALVTSSTVHPYFHDTLDMTRLHDTGRAADVFTAMKARSDLARAALPLKPVDTDDWINTNYQQWMRYTSGSHILGVPCIFYAQWFVAGWKQEPLAKEIPLSDLRKIAAAWRKAGLGKE